MERRKKPVVVQEFQVTADRFRSDGDWPSWLHEALGKYGVGSPNRSEDGGMWIGALEGRRVVSIHDWVVRGVDSELHPCEPGIFEKTYDPASSSVPGPEGR